MSGSTQQVSARRLSARTTPMPRILWIELSSRCPFDCIFCTRASLRGAGEHLDFARYQRLIEELQQPEIIRLNYAGESGHYPRLAEAVALAAATGAEVELVSALASLKPERLQAALEAGLSRLTVSLHTLDAQRFQEIYRFSTLESLHQRLDQVLAWRARAPRPFLLDLAFVAMQRNLDELPALARFAAGRAIPVLAVHPLIARDPLPMGPGSEHDQAGRLAASFQSSLEERLAEARAAAPGLTIELSSAELAMPVALADHPQAWPGPLPAEAEIAACDQSPFDSVHLLADGRVVACEVQEKRTLGDLATHSLAAIWHGETYRQFRVDHLQGRDPVCRACIYKRACRPTPMRSALHAAHAPPAQLLRGWHAADGSGVLWSGPEAALLLARAGEHRRLRLHGMLAAGASDNRFTLRLDGQIVHQQPAAQGGIELCLPLPRSGGEELLLEFHCSAAASPHSLGQGSDLRRLGFALIAVECLP